MKLELIRLHPTQTEAKKIRAALLSGDACVNVWDNRDGTWVGDVYGSQLEASSAANVLRAIADLLEES